MNVITDQIFDEFRRFLLDSTGICLSEGKKALVVSRLSQRLRLKNISGFAEYLELLKSSSEVSERQVAINLLTTNETYFFREQKHFDFLSQYLRNRSADDGPISVWSAACSSGQEPYSIAMVLDDLISDKSWSLYGSDISTDMLQVAEKGIYSLEESKKIPPQYRYRYCLKGKDPSDHQMRVNVDLRNQVKFLQINLCRDLPSSLPMFDVVFLRNIMIYFNLETRQEVIARIAKKIKPGGFLLIGHGETLNRVSEDFTSTAPAIYCRKNSAQEHEEWSRANPLLRMSQGNG